MLGEVIMRLNSDCLMTWRGLVVYQASVWHENCAGRKSLERDKKPTK